MGRYLLRRAGASLVVLFLAAVVVFAGVRALPGDPALALAGEERDPESLAAIRAKYGLDEPILVQFWNWLTLALQGDFGESIRTGIDVTDILLSKLPITIELSVLSVLVAVVLGIPAGVLAAVKKDTWIDHTSSGIALFGLSIPNFWLGLMLILGLAIYFPIFPASGYVSPLEDPIGNLMRMVLPAFVLGTAFTAVVMRQMRSAMVESLTADYIRTARSKGLGEFTVVASHAMRNSLITVTTVVGLQLGALISGAVVTEQIFVIPGFGKLIVDAVFQRDFPVIQGAIIVTTAGYILVNFVVDIVYSLLNPRIRITGAAT
ncbi:ABC transporter permease [Qaidamihabitans albus]|uniref:ABC transporter permease n=1 Tax=Qaidamihabitans albus TaxID=2795733 RepID=UPI0018F11BF8|nr:ABC transporter permease [Qaidamihabitans albus]